MIKCKRILIEFDLDETDLPHATQVEFVEGRWQANGPLMSRFMGMTHALWQLVRTAIRNSGVA